LELATDPTALDGLLAAIAAAGVCAKVRAGATTVEGFPSTEALARFILSCSKAGVPFKATAGLHHAVRGEYRVDYGALSQCATMHGFLNLFVASALLDAGKIGQEELP